MPSPGPKTAAFNDPDRFALIVAQAFFYNAIFFTYALVLTRFYDVPANEIGWYILPFALGNVMGPIFLGRLFDTIGRRPMMAFTYIASGALLVVDAMTGQDAVNTAKAFNDALGVTGIVMTRMDGDARGGAALSMRAVTGRPIKLIGLGEKLDALDVFHPDRIAGRILGMGDVVSLVEKAALNIDQEKARKIAEQKLREAHELLERQAQLDGLTGLPGCLEHQQGVFGQGQPVQQQGLPLAGLHFGTDVPRPAHHRLRAAHPCHGQSPVQRP